MNRLYKIEIFSVFHRNKIHQTLHKTTIKAFTAKAIRRNAFFIENFEHETPIL